MSTQPTAPTPPIPPTSFPVQQEAATPVLPIFPASPLDCFTGSEASAIAWRRQNLGVGACDGTNAAEVSGAPDLHLVFQWEDELCFLSIFPSEIAQPIRAYYVGFGKHPRSAAVSLGASRNFDMNRDISHCSPELVAQVLSTPKRIFTEIRDAKSGKFTDKHVRFDDPEHPVMGTNPIEYTRGDDWQKNAVETGPNVFKEKNATRSRHTGSKPYMPDANGDITSVTQLNELLSNGNPGVELEKIPREACRQRKDAPRWVIDEQKFNKFIVSQGDSAALDRGILYDYYMIGSTDEDVFTAYKAFFAKEEGRQRRTSSVGAVKKRRQRLVEAGNAFYAEAKPVSERRGQSRPDKRAFLGLVGR
jgi:hypothetical protein